MGHKVHSETDSECSETVGQTSNPNWRFVMPNYVCMYCGDVCRLLTNSGLKTNLALLEATPGLNAIASVPINYLKLISSSITIGFIHWME